MQLNWIATVKANNLNLCDTQFIYVEKSIKTCFCFVNVKYCF